MSSAPSNPSDPIFRIEALRSGTGQCLLVHLGTVADPRLIIIDGGPSENWEKELRPRLEQIWLSRRRKRLIIDKVIVTAWKEERVGGILSLINYDLSENTETKFYVGEYLVPDPLFGNTRKWIDIKSKFFEFAPLTGSKVTTVDYNKDIVVKSGKSEVHLSQMIIGLGKDMNGGLISIFSNSKCARIYCGDLTEEMFIINHSSAKKSNDDIDVFENFTLFSAFVLSRSNLENNQNYIVINPELNPSMSPITPESVIVNSSIFGSVNVGFVNFNLSIIGDKNIRTINFSDKVMRIEFNIIEKRFVQRTKTSSDESEKEFHQFSLGIDVLELFFFLTLDRRLPSQFLLKPTPSAFSRAFASESRPLYRPEQVVDLVQHLRRKYPGAEPNPLWVAWMRETQADAVAKLTESLPDLLIGGGAPPSS